MGSLDQKLSSASSPDQPKNAEPFGEIEILFFITVNSGLKILNVDILLHASFSRNANPLV